MMNEADAYKEFKDAAKKGITVTLNLKDSPMGKGIFECHSNVNSKDIVGVLLFLGLAEILDVNADDLVDVVSGAFEYSEEDAATDSLLETLNDLGIDVEEKKEEAPEEGLTEDEKIDLFIDMLLERLKAQK